MKVPNWRTTLDSLVGVAIIALCATMIWDKTLRRSEPARAASLPTRADNATRSPSLPVEPVSLDASEIKGATGARVAVIEYSDFQCPFCVKFARETFPLLQKTYIDSGKVKFAFRHLPLPSIHPRAIAAAQAAVCSGRQGKFWQMHDLLFSQPKQLDDASLNRRAKALQLDSERFEECLQQTADGPVQADLASAATLGLTGTPAFLIGTVQPDGRVRVVERLAGARPFTDFQRLLDKLLER